MEGIVKFLNAVNDNYVFILVIIGLLISIVKKTKAFISSSDDEKVDIAKEQISEIILKLVAEAEVDYEEWNKAGSIKRSQVIKQIYDEYPILSKVVDQQALVAWIDEVINNALKELRIIVAGNQKDEVATAE